MHYVLKSSYQCVKGSSWCSEKASFTRRLPVGMKNGDICETARTGKYTGTKRLYQQIQRNYRP